MMARLASYIAEQVMGSLTRLICALRGHEEYLHFEKNRVYLECVACGHESPGWTVDSRRPAPQLHSMQMKPSPHTLIRKVA